MNIKKTIIEYDKINGYKMNVYYIFIFYMIWVIIYLMKILLNITNI
jgi:hypothetical protein